MIPFSGAGTLGSRTFLGVDPHSSCPSALAPMQDVTGLPFMKLVGRRGEPDMFFTEFFRVHSNSRLDPKILTSVTENPTSRPVFAQLIGENIEDIRRTVLEFKNFPVAGIDLNMGCPAPRVYKKNVGGGLLKDPTKIDQILATMRANWEGSLTVKMRIGFEDDHNFERILNVISKNRINLLSLHVRTVKGGYNTIPYYHYVEKAIELLGDDCPVLVNGSIETAEDALSLKKRFGVFGVMIGRAAIRNPWIFRQIREISSGKSPFVPKRLHLHQYCIDLYNELSHPLIEEKKMVSRMKKFLNYICLALRDDGIFLKQMRLAVTQKELFSVFDANLLSGSKSNLDISSRPQARTLIPNPSLS